MDHLTCLLPGGYVDEGGVLHREAELAPLSGHEEEMLTDRRSPGGAALVTIILSRCVRSLGSISPVPAEVGSVARRRRGCSACWPLLLG